jgi:hypothetical protein
MAMALQPGAGAHPEICQRTAARTNPKGAKTECVFADGSSLMVSNSFAAFICPRDELRFPLGFQEDNLSTQIYLRHSARERRQDILQAEIGYATQPRKDKQGNPFISAEVVGGGLGILAIHVRCEALKDYFYAGNRRRAWDRQPSFYELLRVNPKASPTELRFAFKLRTLELHTASAPASDVRAVERAFNILAHPELRACYDTLLADPASPALFPYGGFGSLLVAGSLSRDGTTFYASRIITFQPNQRLRRFRAPLRRITFCEDHASYWDSRHRSEVLFDRMSLPLSWDAGWNQWKHMLGAKIEVNASFVQSHKYKRHADKWQLVKSEIAVPSRLEVILPSDIAEKVVEARTTHHLFGEFAEIFKRIRERLESVPMARAEIKEMCCQLGVPGDFDVCLITWKPDYDRFFYDQLCKRVRCLYLFRSEYIFDLEQAVVVEIPRLGHATYVFSKPSTMAAFLTTYSQVAREDILRNQNNVAEMLGFAGRLIHGSEPLAWLKELKARLGESPDSLPAAVG